MDKRYTVKHEHTHKVLGEVTAPSRTTALSKAHKYGLHVYVVRKFDCKGTHVKY